MLRQSPNALMSGLDVCTESRQRAHAALLASNSGWSWLSCSRKLKILRFVLVNTSIVETIIITNNKTVILAQKALTIQVLSASLRVQLATAL